MTAEREARDDTTSADAESEHLPSPLNAAVGAMPPLPPLPAQVKSSTRDAGNATDTAAFTTPAPARNRRHMSSSHRADRAAPAVTARYPGSSTAVSTAEKRPPLRRFLGLREENHRDVFLKSLRSDTTPVTTARSGTGTVRRRSLTPEPVPHRAPAQQTAHRQPLTSARAVLATPPPPPLPVQMQMQHPAVRRTDERRPLPQQQQSERGSVTLQAPPPLPAQVQQHSASWRVDLSIFKRAGSDPVYQGEVRQEVGQKLQHRAELTSEKVGFLSGGLRRLKF